MKFCFKSGIVIIYSSEISQYINFITILQKNKYYAVLHFIMSRNAYALFQSWPPLFQTLDPPLHIMDKIELGPIGGVGHPVPRGHLTNKYVIKTNFNILVQERVNYCNIRYCFIKIISPFWEIDYFIFWISQEK